MDLNRHEKLIHSLRLIWKENPFKPETSEFPIDFGNLGRVITKESEQIVLKKKQ
jgi:hypothetical protein